jgi:hypothetical protein
MLLIEVWLEVGTDALRLVARVVSLSLVGSRRQPFGAVRERIHERQFTTFDEARKALESGFGGLRGRETIAWPSAL